MFKVCYIKVNYLDQRIESTTYSFTASNYVFGANNVGKTVMIQAIDFVLGKSNFKLYTKDGLEGIASIEAKLENENNTLYLLRSDNEYGYKYSVADTGYLTVDYELYKKEITAFLIGSVNEYFEEFKDYVEEDLTFRAFSFLNFVDEKGLGNLTNIFTRIDNFYNQKRVRKLMTFLFNHVNVSKLIKLQKQEKILEEDLEKLRVKKATYNYLYGIIINGCQALQIPIQKDAVIEDIAVTFKSFKDTYNRNSGQEVKKTGDIGMLMKMSYNLSEELKYQENLQRQTNFLISRNKKVEQLLSTFKTLIYVDDRYEQYVDEIANTLKKQEVSQEILSIKDYRKTIAEIRTKKAKIDRQIIEAQTRLNKIPFEETLKLIGKVEQALIDIENIPDILEIENKEKQLQTVKNEIKDIKNRFDETLKRRFDDILLSYYSELKGKIDFATKDFKQKNFRMLFDPLKISISGQKVKSDNDSELVSYNPGSMARETTWQILAYLAMFQILKEHFIKLPVMPILFIDGLNQPFDDEKSSYPNAYKFIRSKAAEIGIQLFVVSTRDGKPLGVNDQILLTGFNKSYKHN